MSNLDTLTAVSHFIISFALAITDKCKCSLHRRDPKSPASVVLIAPVIPLKIRACMCSVSPLAVFSLVLGYHTIAVCSYLGLSITLYSQYTILGPSPQVGLNALLQAQKAPYKLLYWNSRCIFQLSFPSRIADKYIAKLGNWSTMSAAVILVPCIFKNFTSNFCDDRDKN